MRFRIKHIENVGYFAQAKRDSFSEWKTIGGNSRWYALYPEFASDYSIATKHEAFELCVAYESWVRGRQEKITYSYVELDGDR